MSIAPCYVVPEIGDLSQLKIMFISTRTILFLETFSTEIL